jgi:hypothetical protein
VIARRAGGTRGRSAGTPASALLIAAGAVAAVLAGVLTAHTGLAAGEVYVALAALGATAWLTSRYGSGVLVGLLVLAAVNALPGPNVETLKVVRGLHLSDVMVLLLALVLAWVAITENTVRDRASVHERVLWVGSLALSGLWLAAGIRVWLSHAIPLSNALFWGRAYLFLAVLPPLFVRALSAPRVRGAALAAIAAGICVTGVAQVVTVASGHQLSLFVHVTQLGNVEGLIRLYSGADWLLPAGVPFGVSLVLFARTRALRVAGAVVLVITLAAFAVELTRALYVGMVVGIALTSALWLAMGDPVGRVGRRRALQAAAVLVAMGAALVLFRPAVVTSSAVNGVVVRATSVFADLSANGSLQDPDLAVRRVERADLVGYLGGSWLLGKGFLDPRYYFVPQVVGGSIQNPDLGYLSAVMTIGVVGLIAVYLPFVSLALALAYQRVRRRGTEPDGWIAYGCLAWIITAVTSSLTVAVMLDPVGAVPCGLFLGLACTSLQGTPRTRSVSPRGYPRRDLAPSA